MNRITLLTLILLGSTVAKGESIRSQSGPISHPSSPESHSRPITVVDGHYTALPFPSVATRWVPAPAPVVTVDPEEEGNNDGTGEESGGGLVGPPQPMVETTPEPMPLVLTGTGLLFLLAGYRQKGKRSNG